MCAWSGAASGSDSKNMLVCGEVRCGAVPEKEGKRSRDVAV